MDLMYNDGSGWKVAVPNVSNPHNAVEWYSKECPKYNFKLHNNSIRNNDLTNKSAK